MNIFEKIVQDIAKIPSAVAGWFGKHKAAIDTDLTAAATAAAEGERSASQAAQAEQGLAMDALRCVVRGAGRGSAGG